MGRSAACCAGDKCWHDPERYDASATAGRQGTTQAMQGDQDVVAWLAAPCPREDANTRASPRRGRQQQVYPCARATTRLSTASTMRANYYCHRTPHSPHAPSFPAFASTQRAGVRVQRTAPTCSSPTTSSSLVPLKALQRTMTLKQEQPSAKADEPEDKKPEEERPREDFNISLDYWTDLTQVFFLGQNENMADSLLQHIKKSASKEVVMEKRGANFSYADVRAYDGPQGEQCVQMCSNVF